MTTIEIHTLSGAYVLHALTPEEAERFEEHLAGCDTCQIEVRELQGAAAELGISESLAPPAPLKARVMAAADRLPQLPPRVQPTRPQPTSRPGAPATSRSASWAPRLLAAAAAILVAVAAGIGYNVSQNQLDDSVTAVFAASDAHTLTVETPRGAIRVATSPSTGQMALDTDELQPVNDQRVYQLWAIDDGAISSAGLLEDVETGAAMPMPGGDSQVAITIEPAGGSEQPTSNPIVSLTPSQV